MGQALPPVGTRDVVLWLLRRRQRVRVRGSSMRPLLSPGDEVLVDPRAYRSRAVTAGDVVVARHPFRRDVRVVKRVETVAAAGSCLLVGDNPTESTDSRSFGRVAPGRILGRVVCRFA